MPIQLQGYASLSRREDQFEFQRIFGMGDLTYRNAKKVYSEFPLKRLCAGWFQKRTTTLPGQKTLETEQIVLS